MRLLSIDNFAVIDILPNPDDGLDQRNWNVVGVSASKSDMDLFANRTPNGRRLQAIIHDSKQEVAAIDIQTLQISKLDSASAMYQNCMTATFCPDGQTMFGIDKAGTVVALCHNLNRQKEVTQSYGMKIVQQPGLLTRVASLASKFRNFIGYQTAPSSTQQENIEPFETLFPILQSTSDGLGLICVVKPGEAFIYTCAYSVALRYKHVSQLLGDKLTGRWWRVCMDEEIILNWLANKGIPIVLTQITYTKTRELKGVIAYVTFVDRNLEILYGIFEKVDTKYELKWGLIGYDFDWIASENETEIPVGKTSFITKLSSKADKIVIAVNTYMGVYICVQDLPGEESKVKLERITVPLCAHCDYGSVLYYDEECWISSIEWLSEDCYFACTTRCGCLSVFHKTSEPMVLNIRKYENPAQDPACNYYQQVFDTRSKKINMKEDSEVKEDKLEKLLPIIQLKWSGPPENVLVVFCNSKLCFFDINRVSNYIEVSDIKIPGPENIVNIGSSSSWTNLPSIGSPTISKLEHKSDEMRFKDERNNTKDMNTNSRKNFTYDDLNLFKDFANNLPQAEIILRPVFVITSEASLKQQRMVQFKFHDKKYQQAIDYGSKTFSDDQLYLKRFREENGSGKDLERTTLSLPDLDTDFELAVRSPPQYMADDEMTDEVENKYLRNRLDTPEPQFRPEYPDDYHSPEEFCSQVNNTMQLDPDSGMDSDNSYSPPFTDDEEANKPKDMNNSTAQATTVTTARRNRRSQLCMLTMPKVPHIDSVIPFVSRTLDNDLDNQGFDDVDGSTTSSTHRITPSIDIDRIYVASSTQTEYDEYTNNIYTNNHRPRCRPVCVVTQPPPPTKYSTRAHSLVSSRFPFEDSKMLSIINDIDDDQLKPYTSKREYVLGGTEYDENNNDAGIYLSDSSSDSESESDSDEDLQALLLNLDETPMISDMKSINNTEESSRKIWEQVSGRFGKNPLMKKKKSKRRVKTKTVGASVPNKVREENHRIPSKLTKSAGKVIHEVNVKHARSTSDKKTSTKDIPKSILTLSKSSDLLRNPYIPENDSVIKTSTFKKFAGRSLSTDASDVILLEHLKGQLHSLKRRQEDSKPNKENGLKKFIHSRMNSTQILTKQETEELMTIQQKQVKLQAASQPNFQANLLNPASKKFKFSGPELRRKSMPALTGGPKPPTKSTSTKKSSLKTPSQGQEFTIGLPSKNPTECQQKSKKNTVSPNKSLKIKETPKVSPPVITQTAAVVKITPKVPPKSQDPKVPGPIKKTSVPIVPLAPVIISPSPKKGQISKSSGNTGKGNRPSSCPSDLSSTTNKVASKKGQPYLPIKKRSKTTKSKNTKPSGVKKQITKPNGPIRAISAEQRQEDIRHFKANIELLSKSQRQNRVSKTVTGSMSSSKPSVSSGSSPVTSSKKTSTNPSKQPSAKTSRNSSKSPARAATPTYMEELKAKMLEELRYEIQRPGSVPSDYTDFSDTEDDVKNQNIGKGLIIHAEVMEDVPLRSSQYKNSDEDQDAVRAQSTTASDRIQRRVSFSNPIAVFKTMSPPSLLKSEGYFEDEDLENLQLRRIQKLFDLS